MPEPDLSPRALCPSEALVESGEAMCFDVLDHGERVPAFALRHEGQVVAYLNRCAHIPAEMDWQPGHFLDQDKRFIVCAMHGALYEPADGLCVSGPCLGARLQPIEVCESGGQVHWYPSERFRALV